MNNVFISLFFDGPNKIKFFTMNGKKLTTENLINLTNLIENYSVTELVDNCLAKNNKKTITILCENNFNNEDSIIIIRTFLQKAKRLLKLSEEYSGNNDCLLYTSPSPRDS